MSAKNQVIAGDYNGKMVRLSMDKVSINEPGSNSLIIMLNKDTVENHQLVDEKYEKDIRSATARTALGGCLLGPVGLLLGLSAKNEVVHTISVSFKNGEKSLLEIDDEIYKALITELF